MKRIGIISLLGLGITVAVGILWFTRNQPVTTAPTIGEAKGRSAVPVPKVAFTDITETSGVRFKHENGLSGKKLLPETMGGGVAVIDYDRDGQPDLFFVNSCPWPNHLGDATATCQMYRNLGGGKFEDVTEKLGLKIPMYGMGVTVGDYDNDGYDDLFVSCVGPHRLFHNEAGRKFTDASKSAGVAGPGEWPKCSWEEFLAWEKPIPFGSSATWLDYNGDGQLDLFVCHYITWSPKIDLNVSSTLRGGKRAFVPPREFDGAQCTLYKNLGGGKFLDVSDAIGLKIHQPDGTGPNARQRNLAKSLGVIACDPDRDGWPDLVVANDTVRNFFFHNVAGPNGERVYQEIAEAAAVAYADGGAPRGGMGIDQAEYAPGKQAIVIANFSNEANTFLKLTAEKPLFFTDAAIAVGLSGPSRLPLKFGAFFFDYDLDGRQDLLTCNGHIEPDIASVQASQTFEQAPQLFWNSGDTGRIFEPVTEESSGPGLFKKIVGRGSAYVDLDEDGDLDLVLVNNGGTAVVLRNDLALPNKSLRLKLVGDGKTANRSAIGAEVTVEANGQTWRGRVAGARGYLSQPELTLTFGLGGITKIDKVTVRWPGRNASTETWMNLAPGKYTLTQGQPTAQPR
jgi:enediyne biosynthesis protein E4